MLELLVRGIGLIGTGITAYSTLPKNCENYSLSLFLFFIIVCAFVLLVWDLINYLKSKEKKFKLDGSYFDSGKKKISDFLVKKLNSAGAVTIFSRDLTWVEGGSSAEMLLIKKSQKGELTIFLESSGTDLALKLSAAGARIHTYHDMTNRGFNPKSRFTILNSKSSGASVMIGITEDSMHFIKEYKRTDIEIFDLLQDYIKLLEINSK